MRMSVGRRYGDPARRWPDVPARQTALRRGFKSADEEKSRLEQRVRDGFSVGEDVTALSF
jgi:hypothetical protein